jgi:hypothetical protein
MARRLDQTARVPETVATHRNVVVIDRHHRSNVVRGVRAGDVEVIVVAVIAVEMSRRRSSR